MLGVHDDEGAGTARSRDEGFRTIHRALVVVLDDEYVGGGDAVPDAGRDLRAHALRERLLEVRAEELLALADDPELARGLPARHLDEVARDTRGFQGRAHVPRRGIGTHRADQRAAGAHRDDVERHVGRPAGAVLRSHDVDHRHWGLLGDARGLAEPVPVHHHVAHDDDPSVGETGGSISAIPRC